MKVFKVCFVLDQAQWDEARELLSESEIREAMRAGGMDALAHAIDAARVMEIEDIFEEKND